MEVTDSTIRLRAIEKEDLPFLKQWINAPATSRYLRASWPISSSEQNEWYESLRADSTRKKLMIEISGGEPIGMFSLMNIDHLNRSVEVGMTIGQEEHLNKGLASRSLRLALRMLFEHFNYNRVWAQILETNQSSLRLFESVGFITEGVLRESAYWEGQMIATRVVSILRSEYTAPPVQG